MKKAMRIGAKISNQLTVPFIILIIKSTALKSVPNSIMVLLKLV